MDPDVLNMQVRKFLKQVGVTSQREIEAAVQQAGDSGRLTEGTTLKATMVLEIPEIGLRHEISGQIEVP